MKLISRRLVVWGMLSLCGIRGPEILTFDRRNSEFAERCNEGQGRSRRIPVSPSTFGFLRTPM